MNFTQLWDSVPAPVRTIINVVAGAGFAAGIAYVVDHLAGGALDVNAIVKVVLVAAGTALVRAINPADNSYGIGSAVPALPEGPSDVVA